MTAYDDERADELQGITQRNVDEWRHVPLDEWVIPADDDGARTVPSDGSMSSRFDVSEPPVDWEQIERDKARDWVEYGKRHGWDR